MQPAKQMDTAKPTPASRILPCPGGFRTIRRRRKSAVSEIIGTILILSLTVVLFAAIFYFVSTLPPPQAQSNSQFTAVLGIGGGGTEAYVNITYQAGPALSSATTLIYLSSSANPGDYSCARVGSYGDPYTSSQGIAGAPTTWSAGQVWVLHLVVGTTVCPGGSLASSNDNITIQIINTQSDIVLFHVSLPGTSPNLPPTFYDYGVNQTVAGIANPYWITTYIAGNYVHSSVNVTYNDGSPGSGVAQPMTYNAATGEWYLPVAGSNGPVAGIQYSFILSALQAGTGQREEAVFYYTFPLPPGNADISVVLTPTNGNPIVREADLLSAVVTNSGSGTAMDTTVTFSWASSTGAHGTICSAIPSGGTNIQGGNSQTITCSWVAGPVGDGDYTLTAVATTGSASATSTVSITVFPRTLVIDETGVAQGSNASTDTFTYLETALSAADIPFNTTVVPPGSSVIGWQCAAPTCLNNYDVVIWLLSNSGSMSASDMAAINSATSGSTCTPACPGDRSVWLLGANAVAGATAALDTSLGITGAGTVAHTLGPSASPSYPLLTVAGPTIPTAGVVPGNLYLDGYLAGFFSQPNYDTVAPAVPAATPFITSAAGDEAVAYNSTYKALTMPIELSTLAMTMPWGGTTYQTSLGQQTSVVYDAFNWLANLTMPGLPEHRAGSDWSVSEVDVQPATLSFNTPSWVNATVRDNGPTFASVTAELTVDNIPLYVAGSPVVATTSPAPFGGVYRFSFNWTPSYIGFLTIGVCILAPSSDLDAANNCLANSLFASQLYVHYNVLLVDGTLHGVAGASCLANTCHDSTPEVYAGLISDGFPAATITQVSITAACGSVPASTISVLRASPPHYNLVVWNLGDVINGTGVCPMNTQDALALESFLNNGGGSSSLLVLGNGLLTDKTPTGAISTFMSTYLGFAPASITSPAPTQKIIYGATGNPVGDGLSLDYDPSLNLTGTGQMNTFGNLNGTTNLWKSVSLYYNDPDYWTIPTAWEGIGISAYSTAADWHTGYLGIDPDVLAPGTQGELDLAMLRFSTFAGRLLPDANTVVSAPDITFALSTSPYTNFDNMHPQLEQQYLVNTNVTNLGGNAALGVGIEVFDGTHILGSNSISVAATTTNGVQNVTLGSATLSVAWTPLYGYTNPIIVELTTASTAQVLPGVNQFTEWNVTVYIFYDSTTNNINEWTHQELTDWAQDGSGSPPVGQQIYYSDDSNVPSGPLTDDSGSGTAGGGGVFNCNLYGNHPCNPAFNGTPGNDQFTAPTRSCATASNCQGLWYVIGNSGGGNGYSECAIAEAVYGGTGNCANGRGGPTPSTNTYYYAYCINEYDGIGVGSPNTDLLTAGDYVWLPTVADGAPGTGGTTSCTPPGGGGGSGATAWTQESNVCYVYLWECVSNFYADSQANAGQTDSVDWIYSQPFDLASVGGVSLASAEADWWQAYAISPYQNGGIVCVTTVLGDCPTGHGGSILNDESCAYPCSANPGDTAVVTPGPGYTGTVAWEDSSGKCEIVQAFTGANTGFTGANPSTPNSWQYESINMSAWIGQSQVYVGFGFVQGTSGSPCAGSASPQEVGWYIDQFQAHVSGGTNTACADDWQGGAPANCWGSGTGSAACGSGDYQDIPFSDIWGLTTSSGLSGYNINATAKAPPTGGAWLNGAVSGTTLALNPNEWDELLSRSIDLTNAANATLTFNYLFSRYAANMDPPEGMILLVSPVLANGATDWVQVWSADLQANGAMAHGFNQNWQFASVNLAGYIGSVVKLQFIIGTNCGGDTDDQADYNFPYTTSEYAEISGVYIQGETTLTAQPLGPAVIAAMEAVGGTNGIHSSGHADVQTVSSAAPAAPASPPASPPPAAANPMAARWTPRAVAQSAQPSA